MINCIVNYFSQIYKNLKVFSNPVKPGLEKLFIKVNDGKISHPQ